MDKVKTLKNLAERIRNFFSITRGIGGRDESTSILAPTPTSLPTPTPTPEPFRFDFSPHINENTKRTIYAPPAEDVPLFQEFFPQEATSAAIGAFNESMYNPEAGRIGSIGPLELGTYNATGTKAGTEDVGYFQHNVGQPTQKEINGKENISTLTDYLRRYPKEMKKMGINEPKDLLDKRKNFAFMKLIREDEQRAIEWVKEMVKKNPELASNYSRLKPWGRLFGWQDQGFVNLGNPDVEYK